MSGEPRSVLPLSHAMANKVLTLLSNVCAGLHLTDMETCHKAFRVEGSRARHRMSIAFSSWKASGVHSPRGFQDSPGQVDGLRA